MMSLEYAAAWSQLSECWAGWMLAMAWQVTVLVAAVWGLSRVLPRSSASFRYALWLLVFVKLALPPTLAVPWSAGNLLKHLPVSVGLSVDREGAASTDRPADRPPGAAPASASVENPVFLAGAENRARTSADERGQARFLAGERALALRPAAGAAMAAWAAVALAMLGAMTVQFWRYRRRVTKGLSPLPGPLSDLAAEQAGRLGLRRRFEVRSSPHVRVPAVLGLWRPVVLLPERLVRELSREQLANLVCHELAHVKRCDIELGWVSSVLLCIYWFHPAVWLANLYLRREREMACDDKVLYTTRQEGRKYAATILRVAESFDGSVPAGAGFLGLLEIADNLLQRIRSVSDVRRPRRAGKRSAAALVVLAALLLPMGVWTAVPAAGSTLTDTVGAEIGASYAQADDEVKEFIKWTAEFFGPQGLWLPEDAFAKLPAEEREAKLKAVKEALEGPEAITAYTALAEAGALRDPSLLPGLAKVAWYMQEGGQDNRSKWMAVAALGRLGDKSAAPVLVPLVDHYNKNVRLWARASLVRLTGQNFGADKKAWADWCNAAGPETAIAPATLEWASRQSEERMKATAASPGAPQPGLDAVAEVEKEIQQHYAKADPAVQEYIRWTAREFGRGGLWQPANAYDTLSPEEREKKVQYTAGALNADYGRHLCPALADAGALKDKRLLPGLITAATFHREDGDYNCRPKWMAVAALGRQDDESAVPTLVPLVDHGNENTRMWARASLVRLTGQNFGADKQAWGKWWNDAGKQPPIDLAQLKPWTPPPEASQPTVAPVKVAVVPEEVAATLQDLPGTLVFKGTYLHRSRGHDLSEPGVMWMKEAPDQFISASYLPALGATAIAFGPFSEGFSRYVQVFDGTEGKPPSRQIMELGRGSVVVKHEGGEKDGQVETLTVPADAAFFDPNTRPDPYATAALFYLMLDLGSGKSAEYTVYDWDNTGKAMASYRIRVENNGKEDVTVPAGTFKAYHLVQTQLSSGDTWYKKRPGHVTDSWFLDNGVVVRILRHREPYEVLLASCESGEPLPGRIEGPPQAAATSQPPAPPDAPAEAENGAVSLDMPAKAEAGQEWFNTGVSVPAGADLDITATGTASWDPRLDKVGPQGAGRTPQASCGRPEEFLMPTAPCGGLVGKVGDSGTPFFVGEHVTVKAESVGTLYLGVNDRCGHFADNDGTFKISVAILQKAPEIAHVSPPIGARDVDPATREIRVTFDQDMSGDGYSWTGSGPAFPKTAGDSVWLDKRTCALPVELEPAKFYRVGINSTSYRNFRGANGVPARDRVLYFATAGADTSELSKLDPPELVSLTPDNGATGVSPSTTSLTVTFSKPMAGGFSWVTLDGDYPDTTGAAEWSGDQTACTLPVRLQPNKTYRLGLNGGEYINFQSAPGVPFEPIIWSFTTGE